MTTAKRTRAIMIAPNIVLGFLLAFSAPAVAGPKGTQVLPIDPKAGVVRVYDHMLDCGDDPEQFLYVFAELVQGDVVDQVEGLFTCNTSGTQSSVALLEATGFHPGRAFLRFGGYACSMDYCDSHYDEFEVMLRPSKPF